MSEGTTDTTMFRRIERLERSNRAMKFLALGAIVASVAFNALPAGSVVFPHGPKRLDAESFNLVSPKGVLLASIGQGPNGGYLAFFDAAGKAEMLVGTSATTGDHTIGVATYDGNALMPGSGKARQVWAQNSTTIGNSIYDGNGKVRLSNVTAGDGSNAGSFFYDANQTLRAGIGNGTSGPGAFFEDSTGTARLTQGISADDSTTSFAMFNTGATIPLYDLSAVGDGSATTFEIKDHNNHARADEGFSTVSGEIILLHDVNQNQTFLAPCTGGAACP